MYRDPAGAMGNPDAWAGAIAPAHAAWSAPPAPP